MRPRHKAAEYLAQHGSVGADVPASMRPRHKAAEYGDDALDEQDAAAVLQ